MANIHISALKQINLIAKHAFNESEFQSHFWLTVLGVNIHEKARQPSNVQWLNVSCLKLN